MIKKILKLTVAVMTLGLFTTSVFAADWGVSGQVRVDWDVSKTVKNDTTYTDNEGIAAGKSRTPNGVIIQEGDSYVQFDLGEENVSAYLRYYPGGNEEYGGSASAESGEWTANAVVSTRNYNATAEASARSGYTNLGSRSGNTYVKIKHASGFSLLLGYTTALDGWRRGRANLLLGDTGGSSHIVDIKSLNSDAMDIRARVVDIGVLNSDAFSLGVVIEQKDSGEAESFGAAFGGLSFGGNGGQTGVVSNNNLALKVGVKAGPVDIGVNLITGSEAGDTALGGDSTYKASAFALGLGVGLKFGIVTPFLNIWSPSASSELAGEKTEMTTFNTNIGVDLAFNETSGISFSSVTRESTVTRGSGETKTKKAAIELGYNTNIGGSAVKVGFVSATETNSFEKDVTVSWLRVRFQQSF